MARKMRWVKGLAAMLALAAPAGAHAAWHEASGKHFVVYSNDDPADIKAFAEELERFDKAIRTLRGIPDVPIGPENRLTVFVVRDVAAVGKLAGNPNIAGFYSGRASGSLAVVPRYGTGGGAMRMSASTVLLHEYTHHLMFSSYPNAAFPGWFTEGFAEFHSTARFEPDGTMMLGRPATHRAWELYTTGDVKIATLLNAKVRNADAIYGLGWLLTHYLSFNETRKAQFGEYVRRLNSGQTLDEASKAFGDLGALDRELRRYMRQRSWSVWTMPVSALPIAPVTLRPLTAGEAATMQVRIRSDVGVNQRTAPGVARDARRAAAPYPNDPAVQAMLAEAEFDAGQYDAALAAAERALAADPRRVPALLYKAQALIAKAVAAKTTDSATWLAARAPLLAANKIDTESPAPLALYYTSFIAAGQTPTKNAGDALLKAQALAPFDLGVRMTAARVLIERKEAEGAKRMLAPVAYDPHRVELGAFATRIIAALDKQDYAAALAVGEESEKSVDKADGEPAGE